MFTFKILNRVDTVNQNDLHVQHWEHFFSDEIRSKLYPTWWDNSTANHWRHERLLEAPLKVLCTERYKSASWLAIGDGSGHDTWILRSNGFDKILTTDIGVGTLDQSLKDGRITRYEQANAEQLQYSDNSFDVVICKEALHHMQRPYAAIYEMIRVAKIAVIIIEPQDQYIDLPCLGGPIQPTYESVGNFVYGFSQIEMQKIGYGLNIGAVATKNIIDIYLAGCEFQKAAMDNPFFVDMKVRTETAEQAAREGKIKWNYLLTIMFKNMEADPQHKNTLNSLTENFWTVVHTNSNPHLT